MKANARQAFNKLKGMGVPVVEFDHYSGHFQISSEESNADEWLDYYSMNPNWLFGINTTITDLLEEYGLFAEWADAAIACVHDI